MEIFYRILSYAKTARLKRAKTFFEKIRGRRFFSKKKNRSKKNWGRIIFLKIQIFIFQKKANFEGQKVIYVGSSDSSVFIGVDTYIKYIDRFSFLCIRLFLEEMKRGAKDKVFEKNKGAKTFFD